MKNSSHRDEPIIDYIGLSSFGDKGKVLIYDREFNLQVTQIRKTRMRGNKLIKHYVVGTSESCNGVYIKDRSGVNYLSARDIPSNIDLFGLQQVTLGSDALSADVNSRDVAISFPMKSFFTFEILSSYPRAPKCR
ncbi:hypothetical protein H5410_046798 [Solanum commersonii]|uniref:Uncharacterized protein n=1 Tax=Solanum commersonii TaxID=4109 RepID=A0A9J5XGI4_SOLCO|nr:hypothetical protein H5410_046798 [Solanum commersonii]